MQTGLWTWARKAGDKGGCIVAQGPPKRLLDHPDGSYTATALAGLMAARARVS